MSYSNWTITNSQATQAVALQASLVSPLSNSYAGTYCLQLRTNNNPSEGEPKYSSITVPSAYSGSAFYGVANTKAIRLQSVMRYATLANGQNFSMCAKVGYGGDQRYGNIFDAYRFGFFNTGAGATLRLSTPLGYYAASMAISADTWYGLRMDIYPIGTSADRIVCYVESSPGSGVWNTVGLDYTLDSTNPSSGYVSWGGSKTNGIWIRHSDFTTSGGYISAIGYIDKVDFKVANAP